MLQYFKKRIHKLIYKNLSGDLNFLVRHIFNVIKRKPQPWLFGKRYIIASSVSKKRLLILAPHPDDEVLGPGGTLSMHLEEGSDVTVVYLTSGERATQDYDPLTLAKIRTAEVEKLAKDFHFNYQMWNLEDGALKKDDHNIDKMVKLLKQLNPNEIYLPNFLDAHPDHLVTNQILAAGLRSLKLENCMILGYEVYTTIPLPNYFVDISDHFNKKMTMLKYHASQLKIYNLEQLCKSRNGMHYNLAAINSFGHNGFFEAFIKLPPDLYLEFVDEVFSKFEDD